MLSFILQNRFRATPRRVSNYPITKSPNYQIRLRSQRGYVLLVLLLFVALLSIGFLAAVRKLDFQVKRDREEEMIHRGVQYSRAIKRFYKKFGRYPTRIEDLESTNNLRFLRKRYKDPMNRDPKTGQERDFKLLHIQDVQLSFNSPQAGLASVQQVAAQQAGPPGGINGTSTNTDAQNPATQDDQSDNSSADQTVSDNSPSSETQSLSQKTGPNGAPQVFGGGAIVGVVSGSKAASIREFNHKDHYNQWQFIYDPSTDRGGLLMTPNQPPLQNSTQNQQQNGQNGTNQNSGFGSSFGNGANPAPQPPTQVNQQ